MRVAALSALLFLTGCSTGLMPEKCAAMFIGDSIIQFWPLDSSFPDKDYMNAGIRGETSRDILSRFSPEVSLDKPMAVVIIVGTNDILRHESAEQAVLNIRRMIVEAHGKGAYPIVCTIPPIAPDITLQQGTQYAGDFNPEIQRLNFLLETDGVISAKCDIHKVLSDPDTGLPLPGVLKDGVHPTRLGYQLMTQEVAKFLP